MTILSSSNTVVDSEHAIKQPVQCGAGRRRKRRQSGGGYGFDASLPGRGRSNIKAYTNCGSAARAGKQALLREMKGGGKLTHDDGGRVSYTFGNPNASLANELRSGYAPIKRVERQCGGRKRRRSRKKRRSRRRRNKRGGRRKRRKSRRKSRRRRNQRGGDLTTGYASTSRRGDLGSTSSSNSPSSEPGSEPAPEPKPSNSSEGCAASSALCTLRGPKSTHCNTCQKGGRRRRSRRRKNKHRRKSRRRKNKRRRKSRRHRRNQRGGSHQYRSNLPDTPTLSIHHSGGYRTANPPPFSVVNNCVDNYNHNKRAGFASPVLDAAAPE